MNFLRLTGLLALVFAAHARAAVLFEDTFDRANSRNIDGGLTGITDNTGSALPVDGVYTQPWLDPNSKPPTYGVEDADAGNGGGSQILSNRFQNDVGAGTANLFVNHNFTNPSILSAGGFSVAVDVTDYSQATNGQGGAIAVGMSQAEAAGTRDAFGGTSRMTGAFGTAIGDAVPTQSVADFWVAVRGNNSLVWGTRSGTVNGVTGLGLKTGTIKVDFTLSSFAAGSTVNYEVFFNGSSKGTGSFTWSGTNENYIGLDSRDTGATTFDNFRISMPDVAPAATLQVTPDSVAHDNSALPVTLNWSGTNLPAGATYQITADQAVSFPNGGASGSAGAGSGSVNAVVNGSLGSTTFTVKFSNSMPTVVATATATVQRIPVPNRPNLIVILADDMGWGDLGCYGSEISTPNIDALAANGVRFRQFYNSARCSPTRCSLLSGLYPQQAAVDPSAPLPDLRADNNMTFAEMLKADGYRTYMAGKWHLGNNNRLAENRGFQHVWRFGNGTAHSLNQWNQSLYTLISENNEIAFRDYTGNGQTFYQTDAIGDYAVDHINHNHDRNDGKPFAMYMAFGAPHFPIQAPAAVADTYMLNYAQGWDVVRQQRYNRQLANGVIDSRYPFPGRGGVGPHGGEPIVEVPAWNSLSSDRQADLTRRMALFAAMITKLDQNVGKVVSRLRELNELDNTLIFFMSDNGGNHEGGVLGNGTVVTGAALTNMGQPGQGDSITYGGGNAHVSNTPLKLFKHFTHEGGIRAPFIVHWPAGFAARNTWVETPTHLIDVVATIADATGAPRPATFSGHQVLPMEGTSVLPLINGQSIPERALYVEHESNRMVRKGRWKLVTENFTAFDNEFTSSQKLLYDMDADPGETTDLAAANPAKVVELVDEWNAWSTRVGLPASRQIVQTPVSLTPGPTAADLFVDTFNRPNATDIDVSNSGMSGSRGNLPWFEGWEGSGTADSIQVLDDVLQMATGTGMSENGLNHNFIGQDILDAGGFSVSMRVLHMNSAATDTANRYAGFGGGLNAAQAAAGNDIGGANPPSIRGNGTNIGVADAFVELDLNGNVKLWTDGVLRATVPVSKTSGTLTASFAFNSFAAGSTVTVSAWFDGTRLDLNSGSTAMTRTFTWDEANQNYLALSSRASVFVQVDNFAVRKLPVSHALAVERALSASLQGADGAPGANPDGDRLDNFGEWAFGSDPTKADDLVSVTSLVLSVPEDGVFRFAHRRLIDAASAGLRFRYRISGDLTTWSDVVPVEEPATPLPASPGYEVVTLSLPASALNGKPSLYLRVMSEPL
ncbi:arylsulfatase [Haloferula sp. BvORR071]|uniref:arylsulfatase n=1 Tax=Haloferula sp. BvORR071 TaxID=1396141 RepID=UPI000697312F|nr:arylsulfatase [Haloferula sp. BvORR071]